MVNVGADPCVRLWRTINDSFKTMRDTIRNIVQVITPGGYTGPHPTKTI